MIWTTPHDAFSCHLELCAIPVSLCRTPGGLVRGIVPVSVSQDRTHSVIGQGLAFLSPKIGGWVVPSPKTSPSKMDALPAAEYTDRCGLLG